MTTLYLVDDHLMVRESLRFALEAAGHQVLGEADNPTQALADVARLEPDVMLLDLHLDGRSGLEVLEQLGKRGGRTRVLILTMSDQPRHLSEALRLGAAGYVLKGSKLTGLLDAIARVARGEQYLGPEVAGLAAQVLRQGPASQEDPLESLSPRERQIITMVVRGQSSSEVGAALHLSPRTVDTYRSRLMAKLGVSDFAALVRLAVRSGWIESED